MLIFTLPFHPSPLEESFEKIRWNNFSAILFSIGNFYLLFYSWFPANRFSGQNTNHKNRGDPNFYEFGWIEHNTRFLIFCNNFGLRPAFIQKQNNFFSWALRKEGSAPWIRPAEDNPTFAPLSRAVQPGLDKYPRGLLIHRYVSLFLYCPDIG